MRIFLLKYDDGADEQIEQIIKELDVASAAAYAVGFMVSRGIVRGILEISATEELTIEIEKSGKPPELESDDVAF